MRNKKLLTALVILVALLASSAALVGITSNDGPGKYDYLSIRGRNVEIYGLGIYKDMSAEVAVQGIAQDYITLFAAVPLLLISFYKSLKNSAAARIILTGTFGYFFVTYLFYTTMGMFNYLFLIYSALIGLSFFGMIINLLLLKIPMDQSFAKLNAQLKFAGIFLLTNTFAIALMWLQVIVPPLINGNVYPPSLDHYTTLIVQGLDLGLLLPLAFASAYMLLKKRTPGYYFSSVYMIFLSLLMTALTAKIIAMGMSGVNIIPAVFIIPVINLAAIISSVLLIKNLKLFISK